MYCLTCCKVASESVRCTSSCAVMALLAKKSVYSTYSGVWSRHFASSLVVGGRRLSAYVCADHISDIHFVDDNMLLPHGCHSCISGNVRDAVEVFLPKKAFS